MHTEAELADQRGVPDDKIEEAILSLPDVQSCSVELNPDGSISAIHIVSSGKRAPKQIVRDVESVLQAHFSIKVDHRKVSVAKIEEKKERAVERLPRPRLDSIKVSTAGGKGSVEVTLEREGLKVSGRADGVAIGGGILRLIAKATLRAIENIVTEDIGIELLDLVRVRGEHDAIVVLANLATPKEVKKLAGCVIVGDDEYRSAALAALDACNRIISTLPQIEQVEYEVTSAGDE